MKALINENVAKAFEIKTGIEAIPLKPYNRLDLPISAHADMLFCVLDNMVFCYEDYVIENSLLDVLVCSGKTVVNVRKSCSREYPNDIGLNVLIMGKTIFCNIKYAAKEILEYASEHGYEIINVKQGYSACSTLVLNDNVAITSDKSIAIAVEKSGKQAILIDNSKIKLEGYNCGFIGGASGVFAKDVYVFGDILTLTDGKRILDIINNLGFNIITVLFGDVCDFGGVKFI